MTSSCAACARRSELLARLCVSLDFRARDLTRLWKTLELPDEQLIAALGGGRREELRAWWTSATSRQREEPPAGIERVCRHLAVYPSALRLSPLAPHELHVAGGARRLHELLDGPVVAIVGSTRCSDYGLEVARSLARELAAVGVCVIGELADGISRGAHLGALQDGGPAVAIAAGGLDRRRDQLHRGMTTTGAAVSEMPCGTRPCPWSQVARARTIALLADLVIVVEAERGSRELACPQLARALGRKLGAVPGRVSSPLSRGTHDLLRDGASLVRGAEDALDVLSYEAAATGPPSTRPPSSMPPSIGTPPSSNQPSSNQPSSNPSRLDRRLRELMRMIDGGMDTTAKLAAVHERPDVLLRALAELELAGLVRRGDGGRYVPCAIAACG